MSEGDDISHEAGDIDAAGALPPASDVDAPSVDGEIVALIEAGDIGQTAGAEPVESVVPDSVKDSASGGEATEVNFARSGEGEAEERTSGGERSESTREATRPAMERLSWLVGILAGTATLFGFFSVWLNSDWFSGSEAAQYELMTGDLNIAVAEFVVERPDGSEPDTTGVASSFHRKLVSEIEMTATRDFDIQIVGPDTVGSIQGEAADSREISAEQIAVALGADIVIYGVYVFDADGLVSLVPSIFLGAGAFPDDAAELTATYGGYGAGAPIALDSDPQVDRISRAATRTALLDRAEALAEFAQGLFAYKQSDYGEAIEVFSGALEGGKWPAGNGREVVHILLGNAHGRHLEFTAAAAAFRSASEIDPEYARAYVGLAEVTYVQACIGQGVSSGCCSAANTDIAGLARAIEEYEAAGQKLNQPATAEIPVKVTLGIAKANICTLVSMLGRTDTALAAELRSSALAELQSIIDLYHASSGGRKRRLTEMASEAYGFRGLLEGQIVPDDPPADLDAARLSYELALELAIRDSRKSALNASLARIEAESGNCELAASHYLQAISLGRDSDVVSNYRLEADQVASDC